MPKVLILYIFIIFFSFLCLTSAQNLPSREYYGKVILNNYSNNAGIAPVVFDHWLHRAKFTCRLCHIDIGFAMKAEATNTRAVDNINGYHCGSCHNGKMVVEDKEIFAACAVEFTDEEGKRCVRCHSKGKTRQREYDFKTFTENLPLLRGNLIDWEKAEAEGKITPIDILEGVSFKRDPLKAQEDFGIEVGKWRRSDVIFSHKKHVVWNGCAVCHPLIFPITKKGTIKYSMNQIREGEYCGVCHDRVAFSVWLCYKCHLNMTVP